MLGKQCHEICLTEMRRQHLCVRYGQHAATETTHCRSTALDMCSCALPAPSGFHRGVQKVHHAIFAPLCIFTGPHCLWSCRVGVVGAPGLHDVRGQATHVSSGPIVS